MPDFELDEATVSQCEVELGETGTRVFQEANRAALAVQNARGAWQGEAFASANNVQGGKFMPLAQELNREIHRVAEALGFGRNLTISEDANSGSDFNAIPVEMDGFRRV